MGNHQRHGTTGVGKRHLSRIKIFGLDSFADGSTLFLTKNHKETSIEISGFHFLSIIFQEREMKIIKHELKRIADALTVIGKDKLELQEQIDSLKQQVSQLEHDRDFYMEKTLHG